MTFVIEPAPQPIVPVDGGGDFPVRRIYCVGRNYADHAREMGGDPDREAPFFFMKPADAVVPTGATIPYPPQTANLHHEIELVVAIGTGGADIAVADALDHVFGYATGIDLTRRDLQAQARDAGRPWDMAKGFDRSAPCGPIRTVAQVGHVAAGAIALTIDGAPRQSSDVAKLIWSVPEVIAYLSGLVTLKPGDLIFTGTPEGVGPVIAGQTMLGHIDGLVDIEITIG
jgi:fumarylpyruvate hydrolase